MPQTAYFDLERTQSFDEYVRQIWPVNIQQLAWPPSNVLGTAEALDFTYSLVGGPDLAVARLQKQREG